MSVKFLYDEKADPPGYYCPICSKMFSTLSGIHGHYGCHSRTGKFKFSAAVAARIAERKLLRKMARDKERDNKPCRAYIASSHKGWKLGIQCDSTWEAAVVLYYKHNGWPIERNNKGFFYRYHDKKYRYYPDFVIGKNHYLEVKGYVKDKDQYKWDALRNEHGMKLTVLGADVFKSVINTFLISNYPQYSGSNILGIFDEPIITKRDERKLLKQRVVQEAHAKHLSDCYSDALLLGISLEQYFHLRARVAHDYAGSLYYYFNVLLNRLTFLSSYEFSSGSVYKQIPESVSPCKMQMHRMALSCFGLSLKKLAKLDPKDRKLLDKPILGIVSLEAISNTLSHIFYISDKFHVFSRSEVFRCASLR